MNSIVTAIVTVCERLGPIAALHRGYAQALAELGLDHEFVYVLDGPYPEVAATLEATLVALDPKKLSVSTVPSLANDSSASISSVVRSPPSFWCSSDASSSLPPRSARRIASTTRRILPSVASPISAPESQPSSTYLWKSFRIAVARAAARGSKDEISTIGVDVAWPSLRTRLRECDASPTVSL